MMDDRPSFLNFEKICRICMTENFEMRSIFEPATLELIQICGNIAVEMLDGLPSLICIVCLEKAQNAFTFRQQCKRSDSLLRELARNSDQTYFLVQCNNGLFLASDENPMLERPRSMEMPALMPLSETSNHLELEAVDAINQALQAELDRRNNTDKHSNEIIEFLNDRSIPEINELTEEYMQMIGTHIDDPGLIDDAASVEVLSEPHPSLINQIKQEINLPTTTEVKLTDFTNIENVEKYTKPPLRAVSVFFTCHMCQKQLKTKKSFLQHLKRHEASAVPKLEPPSLDNREPVIPTQTPNLTITSTTITTPDPKKFSCETCGKRFNRRLKLDNHIKVHLGIKDHHCNLCPKQFMFPWQLKVHLKSHLNQRDFTCPYCERAFGQNINLQNHIKAFHTFEKNFKCTYEGCARAFVTRSMFNKHLGKHRGEKTPHKVFCPVCNKGCPDSGQLKVHMRCVHSKERPYSCTLCPKTYLLHNHLVVHMRSHTNTKPFQCSQCPKSFYTASQRTKHTVVHARVKDEGQKTTSQNSKTKRKSNNDDTKSLSTVF